MSHAAPNRYLYRWVDNLQIAQRARFAVGVRATRPPALGSSHQGLAATLAVRACRWAADRFERLTEKREPRDAQELLAYASSIENTMPSLAAEFRFLACRD